MKRSNGYGAGTEKKTVNIPCGRCLHERTQGGINHSVPRTGISRRSELRNWPLVVELQM